MAKKKNKNIWIILLIVGVIGGFFLFKSGNLNNLIYGQPSSCDITPTHPDCFCGEGETKIVHTDASIRSIVSTCEPNPDLPDVDVITLPIETWEEAIAFSENYIFPSSQQGTICTGELGYRNLVSGTIPEQLFEINGVKYQMVEIACTKVLTESSGQLLYEILFRTDDSCIFRMTCTDSLASELGLTCPEDVDFDLTFSNCPLQ